MSLGCATVVSFICFHSSAAIEHRDWGLGRGDTITTAVYVADSWTDDNFVDPNWRLMPIACEGSVCFRYFKHCAAGDDGFVCTYQFGRPGGETLRHFRLRASTLDALAAAEADVVILTNVEAREDGVSLSRFSQQSPNTEPPICLRRMDPALCQPEAQ